MTYPNLKPWCVVGARLAAVRFGPFVSHVWWCRQHPDPNVTDYAPGPFHSSFDELAIDDGKGYIRSIAPRHDGRDRPSIYAPRKEVVRRWPRLIAMIQSSANLTADEASYALWCYIQGIDGGYFGRRYCEILDVAVRRHFGYTATGEVPHNGKAYWQKAHIETMLQRVPFVREHLESIGDRPY